MCSINRLKTIKDINVNFDKHNGIPKESFKILMIDDHPKNVRHLVEQCKKNEYNIVLQDDFINVEQCRDYNLILIDVRGVGGDFSKEGGFGVAKAIADQLPNTEIVLFTAYESDVIGDGSPFKVINKPIKADKLCLELDNIRKDLADPIKGWEKIKEKCLEENIPFKHIAIIEDKYVRSYNKGTPKITEGGWNGFSASKVEEMIISFAAQVVANVLMARMM